MYFVQLRIAPKTPKTPSKLFANLKLFKSIKYLTAIILMQNRVTNSTPSSPKKSSTPPSSDAALLINNSASIFLNSPIAFAKQSSYRQTE